LFSSTLITFLIQGALDGGLDIPHSGKRFAGFSKEDKSLNAETHHKYILGGHIADYMKLLKEEEPEKYQAHFSGLLKEGFEADDLAEMYTSVHAAIHADPSAHLTEKNAPTEKKIWKMKLSYEERKAALISQLNALNEEGDE
jgi:large subunit ribosomal protein L5e